MELAEESIFDKKDRLFAVAEKSASAPFLYNGINFDKYIEFNRSISKFTKEARDRKVLDIWRPVIQNYKKISLLLGTTPLQAYELENLYPVTDPPITLINSTESSLLSIFDQVRTSFEQIRESPNYLWKNFIKRIKTKTEETDENDNDYKILNGYGVVCPWNDLLNSFKQKIEKIALSNLNVYLLSELKLVEPFFHMTIFGSSVFYEKIGSGQIFNNPRSKYTEIIAYNIYPQPPLGEYFLTGSPHNYTKSSEIQPTERREKVEFLPEVKIQENNKAKKGTVSSYSDKFEIDLTEYFDSEVEFSNEIITYK